MGDDTVAGGEDVRDAGAHLFVDDHRASGAERRTRGLEQGRVGADADDGEDQVGGVGDGLTILLCCTVSPVAVFSTARTVVFV